MFSRSSFVRGCLNSSQDKKSEKVVKKIDKNKSSFLSFALSLHFSISEQLSLLSKQLEAKHENGEKVN